MIFDVIRFFLGLIFATLFYILLVYNGGDVLNNATVLEFILKLLGMLVVFFSPWGLQLLFKKLNIKIKIF